MKERPIIFNAEMVRAILDGRKTQTRRALRIQPTECNHTHWPDNPNSEWKHDDKGWSCAVCGNGTSLTKRDVKGITCPFGKVGDRLWVRETWGVVSHAFDDDGMMVNWIPDRPATGINEMPFGNGYYSGHAIYAADGAFTWGDDDGHVDGRSCWKPSIHMPRAASRILLEITDVRVERLNDISEEDAKAEGAPTECCVIGDKHFLGFRTLWKSIYGAESWEANPWVWVIEFKRMEATA